MKKIFLLLLSSLQLYGAMNITTLNQYASQLQEYPKTDNTNWVNPNYTSYYKSIEPNIFTRWFRSTETKAAHVQTLLKNITAERTKYNGRFIMHLVCKPESKIYIWGELHGAFHSLVRDLNWLMEKKVITKELKIVDPDTYFVFNGDAIDRSPNNIEALITIISLMQQNTNQVFYLRGPHEDHGYWTNFDLKIELKIRAAHISHDIIPLEKELNSFFDTLPLALYVSLPNEMTFIRISQSDRENNEIKEASLAPFLKATGQKEGISFFDLRTIKKGDDKAMPEILVIIKSENWQKEFRAHNGLGLIDQDQGSTAWAVFSSPTQAHQEYLDFKYDAFTRIDIKNPLIRSNITSYYHACNDPHVLFQESEVRNIVTALPITDSMNTKELDKVMSIGSTMALVQGVPIMGQRTKRGMNVRIDQENASGGVKGTRLRTIIYNDNYTPSLARANIDRLMQRDKTDIILLPVGSPTLNAYLDYIEKKEIAVLFPVTGGPQFRDAKYKGMIHFTGTYADEVRALIDYIATEGSARKFALFYQNDAYGKGPLEAAHEELKRKGITLWLDVPYQRNSVNFKEQAEKIKDYQPDAIGLFTTAQSTTELIRQIGI